MHLDLSHISSICWTLRVKDPLVGTGSCIIQRSTFLLRFTSTPSAGSQRSASALWFARHHLLTCCHHLSTLPSSKTTPGSSSCISCCCQESSHCEIADCIRTHRRGKTSSNWYEWWYVAHFLITCVRTQVPIRPTARADQTILSWCSVLINLGLWRVLCLRVGNPAELRPHTKAEPLPHNCTVCNT